MSLGEEHTNNRYTLTIFSSIKDLKIKVIKRHWFQWFCYIYKSSYCFILQKSHIEHFYDIWMLLWWLYVILSVDSTCPHSLSSYGKEQPWYFQKFTFCVPWIKESHLDLEQQQVFFAIPLNRLIFQAMKTKWYSTFLGCIFCKLLWLLWFSNLMICVYFLCFHHCSCTCTSSSGVWPTSIPLGSAIGT